ncbi:MAG: hypothetical protein LC745_06960 [Planctomycetia bacterium]|nr:hypothetical protein [Planctomycetia bacterium]
MKGPPMTILFSSLSPVKPASHRFGKGLLASRPAYTAPYTASDAACLAADNARRGDAHFDRLAGESAALDLMEAGLSCC